MVYLLKQVHSVAVYLIPYWDLAVAWLIMLEKPLLEAEL
jgi:hypothetical protein